MTDYYSRTGATHLDGTPIFATAEDQANEKDVAGRLARAWGCRLHQFGVLSPVDWFAERDGRLVGVLELKSRTHEAGRHPTVFLNVRKWLALHLCATGLGVPALFVVRFTDSLMWVPVSDVPTDVVKVSGCRSVVKSRSDVEPVIEVPVAAMKAISIERR
jgi:hypothetical protein